MARTARSLLVIVLTLSAGPIWAAESPLPVSPGATDRMAVVSAACPTFSWGAVADAEAYELVVYTLGRGGELVTVAGRPGLRHLVPGAATSYTPELARCLVPGGRYAWAVRVLSDAGTGAWSEAHLFEVAAAPNPDELARAVELVQRYLLDRQRDDPGAEAAGSRGAAPPTPSAPPDNGPRAAENAAIEGVPTLAGAVAAIRAELAETSGETVGLLGISHSPAGAGLLAANTDPAGGADLVLDGSAQGTGDTLLSESDVTVGGTRFEIGNATDDLTLTLDGTPIVTTATDQDSMAALACSASQVPQWDGTTWICANATGDTLAGLSCAANEIAKWNGSAWICAIDEASGGAGDADTLDLLDSLQFLRSDEADTMTGTLTLAPATGAALDLGGDVLKNGTVFLHDGGDVSSTALGTGSLTSNTSGHSNTAVGNLALSSNTIGFSNTALGIRTLSDNTSGHDNSAIGWNALNNNTTGSDNHAIGASALFNNNNGIRNIAIGHQSLYSNITGNVNVAIGTSALRSNTGGSGQVAIGFRSLMENEKWNNTALGTYALHNSTGADNIAIGNAAGRNLTTGDNNIHIGNQGADTDTATIKIGTSQTRTIIAGIHGTALSGSPVVVDAFGQLGVSTAGGGDADTLDGLDSLQFLRSDAEDTFSGAKLTVAPGSELSVNGVLNSSSAGGVALPVANISGAGAGSGLDADQLDGQDSSYFMPMATDLWVDQTGDTMTGTLTLDPASGNALETTADIDLAGRVLRNGTVFLHDGGGGALDANTALGRNSLQSVTPGVPSPTHGRSNTAIGQEALAANNTGHSNTAVGNRALAFNTTGYRNTALGVGSLLTNEASFNTGVGFWALYYSTSGLRNTALGSYALFHNDSGSDNLAGGAQALFSNTTGQDNVANGAYALHANITGSYNTAVGRDALKSNTGGNGHVALGWLALELNDRWNNTALGTQALRYSTGHENIAIGNAAGKNLTTGDNNIHIGNQGVADDTKKIKIGTQGTQTETFIAGIYNNVVVGSEVLVDSTGQLGSILSSRRFKEAIADMGPASARLLALRPVTFRYKKAPRDGKRPLQFGLIAEEVAEVFPELVIYDEAGQPQTVKYHLLSSLLLNELQREHQVNEKQEAEIRRLTARLERLEAPG